MPAILQVCDPFQMKVIKMTVKECYEFVGGDYDEVIARLMKEERVVKYLGKFINDPSYQELLQAVSAQDWETLFRASHTMKGVCYNLSLKQLGDAASEVCEAVRPGVAPKTELAPLLEVLKANYEKTTEGITACIPQQ